MTEAVLVRFNQARHALAMARRIDEVKAIRDKAEALRLYAKQAGESLEMQNDIAEIKLRAERRAGELLDEMEKNPGGQAEHESYQSHDATTRTPTLSDMGISKSQSSRWQLIASMPEPVFEEHIAVTKAEGRELTTAGILRLAARLDEPAPAATPPFPQGKYRCIVIDPPWPVQKIEREERPLQGRALDYPVMSLDEIARLPIIDLAYGDGCHLYLWTTHKYLPASLQILEGWGFRYQCLMTWIKPTGMTPYSWMYNTEFAVFARCGNLRLEQLGLKLAFEAGVNGHSTKPDVFYERVIQASPGPRLEMFARQQRPGFTVWGNEVNGLFTGSAVVG